MKERKLVLEDGREFYGEGFGADVDTVVELLFNTAMVGYQEVLSNPVYFGHGVVMTYPIIGSYGVNEEDSLAKTMAAGALVVREYNDSPSNFRYTKTLAEAMEEFGIPGIAGVDTRAITRILRSEGTQKAMLTAAGTNKEAALAAIKNWQYPETPLAAVSCKKRWYARTQNPAYNVTAVDLGLSHSGIKELNRIGCNVTVVPYNITAQELLALAPDGVFLAGGPGGPAGLANVVDLIKALPKNLPLFGVGLGHIALGLAAGATAFKLKTGHHGQNQMVQNIKTGLVQATSQSHGWALELESLAAAKLTPTYLNLLDGTVEGVKSEDRCAFSAQFYPGAGTGAEEPAELYEEFLKLMKGQAEKNA